MNKDLKRFIDRNPLKGLRIAIETGSPDDIESYAHTMLKRKKGQRFADRIRFTAHKLVGNADYQESDVGESPKR